MSAATHSAPYSALPIPPLPEAMIAPAVQAALLEDWGRAGDVTTDATIPMGTQARADVNAREPGVAAGVQVAELAFRLGDRVEVTDEGGSVWMGRTSDSFRYDSHCVTVVEISHVGAPGGTQQSGSAGERRSSEMSELSAAAGSEGYAACSDDGQVSRETGKEGQA